LPAQPDLRERRSGAKATWPPSFASNTAGARVRVGYLILWADGGRSWFLNDLLRLLVFDLPAAATATQGKLSPGSRLSPVLGSRSFRLSRRMCETDPLPPSVPGQTGRSLRQVDCTVTRRGHYPGHSNGLAQAPRSGNLATATMSHFCETPSHLA
jgi:hypothetical protein